jgi:excisionase family DNA binding protein
MSEPDAHTAPKGVKPLTVTVATARKVSGLGNTTVWALIKTGKLEVVRVGRRTLVTYRSLEKLLTPGNEQPWEQINA